MNLNLQITTDDPSLLDLRNEAPGSSTAVCLTGDRREPNVLASKELLDTTRLEESSITRTSSSSLPQSPLCEVPDILALELNTTPSLSSCVTSLTPTGLLIKHFVRVDKGGIFHTYPDCGGPFQSLQEAQQAIDSYHVVERKNMCMDGLSSEDRFVRHALYWHHNGTRKNSAEAFAAMATCRPVREVVKALLDKYNDDNCHLGDPVYELKEIVSYKPCFDGKGCTYRSYSHLNMTMKTKGDDDPTCANNKLFFAEVTCMIDEHEEYVLTCICPVEPDDNGECHMCGDEMKHPTNAEYKHGRPMSPVRWCSHADADDLYDKLVTVRDEAWLKAEEARVRRMFKELDEAIEKDNKYSHLGMFEKLDEAEVDTAGDNHGKRDKYVVPARRK